MNIAIMTWYHYRNYGTTLQVSALSEILHKYGHDSKTIQYKPYWSVMTLPNYHFIPLAKRLLQRNSTSTYFAHYCPPDTDAKFQAFLNDHICMTEPCNTKADLEMLNDKYDAFVCGSDQIWSPLCFNPHYYLDFVHDSKKKIAYAPSFGVKKIEDQYIKEEIKRLVHDFNFLSVREKDGQKIISDLIGESASIVLDPTLLLTREEWINNFQIKRNDNQPYILAYMLGKNEAHWEIIYAAAKEQGLDVKCIPVFEEDLQREGCINTTVGPQEFLQLFHDAAYVCTDSFHGLIFALQFHKDFSAFLRFNKTDPQNQNSRIFNLLSTIGLTDRIVTSKNYIKILNSDIDYSYVDDRISKQRDESLHYLNSALENVKSSKTTKAYHVMKANSICCGCGSCQIVCPTAAVSVEINDKGFFAANVDEKRCISCKKCIKICPFSTETLSYKAVSNSELYAFKNLDFNVLMKSTSGAAAYSIAKYLIGNGYTVSGCMFDEKKQQARHIIVDSEDDLFKIQGSKYIQSSFSDALEQLLNITSPIAIFGTPCQIAAARRLFKNRQDVIYIDLICHGVPSYWLYEKYRNYIVRSSNIKSPEFNMTFRYKEKGWRTIYLHATDGENEYCQSKVSDPFFRMFEVGNCYMETCYDCRWRVDSEADIRLGDYWGPRFERDSTGISMVLTFTQKGKNIIKSISDLYDVSVQRYPVTDYLKYQQSENCPMPVFYKRLLESLKDPRKKLEDIVQKYAFPFENKHLSKKEHIKYVIRMMIRRM